MNYDFSELSDIEFEELINKLLSRKSYIIEQYCKGKDGGTDGVKRNISKDTVIQVKHYQKSGFSALKATIKNKELDKIKKLNCNSYLLATSIDLSRQQAEDIRKIIKPIVSEVIVLGYEVIKNLLDNDTDTLKSTVKLWALNSEIVKQVLHPENESRFIELQNRWMELNKVFVETPDVKNVIDKINKEHVAIIAGVPGVGKTTLAEFLCLYFFKEGFEIQIFEGDFSREKYDLSNHDKKVLYYFDDFLGSNYLNCLTDKSDTAIVSFLKQISKEKNKRFILTSRINIINKVYMYSQAYRDYHLDKNNYIVNVGNYDEMTKGKILYNHLWHSDLTLDIINTLINSKEYKKIINHPNFNPRLIQFITQDSNLKESGLNYLTFVKNSLANPTQIWEQCFQAQLNDSQRLVVKIVVANGGNIEETHLKKAYGEAFELLNLQRPSQESCEYTYIMKICMKSILNKNIDINNNHSTISVFNPSVSDYIIPILLNNESELLVLCKALRSVKSVQFIESQINEKSTKVKIYSSLLDQYGCDEWNEVKILLIGLLNKKELLSDLANNIELYKHITIDNASVMYKMLLSSINDFDWSDFLNLCCDKICDIAEEYYEIYDTYSKCQFVNKDVLVGIHDMIVECITNYFEDDLKDSDGFEDCYSAEDIDKQAKTLLEEKQNEIPILTEYDIKEILKAIDAEKLASDNIENQYDFDIDYQQQNDKSDIDEMFIRLLDRN